MKKISKISSPSYLTILEKLKHKIHQAQQKAVLSVNQELILLYWDIGTTILEQQKKQGWGAKIIDRLSRDLVDDFPGMKGISPRNLKYMRSFAEAYPDLSIVQQPAAQIPWFHNCVLLDKVPSQKERIWYIGQTIKNGWSRNVLVHQIESRLYQRQRGAQKITNFKETLPAPQSDLAWQTIKDPYVLEFLGIPENQKHSEKELEQKLIDNMQSFLLELGKGFGFVARQFRLTFNNKHFYVDLVFYHRLLRCFVLIDLKVGTVSHHDIGQMNMYLNYFKKEEMAADDNEPIGIVLGAKKDHVLVEYALGGISNKLFASKYRLSLPDKKLLQSAVEQIVSRETREEGLGK